MKHFLGDMGNLLSEMFDQGPLMGGVKAEG